MQHDCNVVSACWQHDATACCAPARLPGGDVAVHSAHSGVQCRHICQAHETCAYWTYIVNAPQVPENLRGRCFLKSESAVANRGVAHPFVVSGERLCQHFGEGLSFAAARERIGLQTPTWRTSVGVTEGRAAMLPGSGTEHWFREAAKALEEVGFATQCHPFSPILKAPPPP